MLRFCSVVRRAWSFICSQPVLADIALWLIAVPYTVRDAADIGLRAAGWHTDLLTQPAAGVVNASPLLLALTVAAALCHVWGEASALLACKRLLTRNAGRARTSFAATAKQGRGLIVPLLVTEILWSCNAFLWGLLLFIPGVVAGTRTFFCPVTAVAEGKTYRDALRTSATVVRGRTVETLIVIIGIVLVAFTPPALVSAALHELTVGRSWWIVLLSSAIAHSLWGASIVFFEAMCTIAYADLKQSHKNASH